MHIFNSIGMLPVCIIFHYISIKNKDHRNINHCVLLRVTIAVMKHHDQNKLGRKGFYFAHSFHFIIHH